MKQERTFPVTGVPTVDDPHGFTHRFAEANGIRVHYVEEGDGPLVILLHGFPYLWYMWRRQIRALEAGRRWEVAFDPIGPLVVDVQRALALGVERGLFCGDFGNAGIDCLR